MPPSSRTPEEYEEELRALRDEIERLRGTAVTFAGAVAVSSTGGQSALTGLEELILQVSSELKLTYLNPSMARLLGVPDRKKALGTSLSQWDQGPIGAGLLAGLVYTARGAPEAVVVERSIPGLDRSVLPGDPQARPSGETILRFTAARVKDSIQVVAQDVTRLRWLERTFSRYVSSRVIEQMLALPAAEALRMERRELTVLFADLRGFTAMSERLPLEELSELVNSFLAAMVGAVEQVEGTVDKFLGDAVMALFGAPVPQKDHALRGLVCAAEMHRRHHEWSEARKAQGRPTCGLGVGLASGTVAVGNLGTGTRMEYSALGPVVNLASRLCGAAEAGEILTIPATHAHAMAALQSNASSLQPPRLSFKPKGAVSFKNVAGPVEVVSVTAGAAKSAR